jgi:hypothetical protein
MGNQYTKPDSVEVNVTRINNTEADLAANLGACQIGVANDTHALVFKNSSSSTYACRMNKISDGLDADETVSATAMPEGVVKVALTTGNYDVFIDPLMNAINGDYGTDSESYLRLNYYGYLNSNSQFRNTTICDGKGYAVVTVSAEGKNVGIGGVDPEARLHLSNSMSCNMFVDNTAPNGIQADVGTISFRATDSSSTMVQNAFIKGIGNHLGLDQAGRLDIGIGDADATEQTMISIGFDAASEDVGVIFGNDYSFDDSTGTYKVDGSFQFAKEVNSTINHGICYNVGAVNNDVSKMWGQNDTYINQVFEDAVLFSTTGASVDIIQLSSSWVGMFHGDIQVLKDRESCGSEEDHAAFRKRGVTLDLYSTTTSGITTDAYSSTSGALHMIWDENNFKLTLKMAGPEVAEYIFPVMAQYRVSLIAKNKFEPEA